MWAYALREKSCGLIPEHPRKIPETARIRRAADLQVSACPDGGIWFGPRRLWAGHPIDRSSLRDPVRTADGLWYYAPQEMPAAGQLRRSDDDTDLVPVELASGQTILIRPAYAAPRSLSFGVGDQAVLEIGDFTGGYGQAAHELWQIACMLDEDQDMTAIERVELTLKNERLTHQVILSAVQSTYLVTEELLSQLGWITSADIQPILFAAWGVTQGKAGPPDGGA